MSRLFVLLCLAGLACAQVNTGTVLGTVTDPTGAAVVGAKVTAINELTGFSRTVESGGDGSYLIPLLPISDQYRVNVEAAGFKSFVRTAIVLQLNQNARVDVQMQLGALAETVEISAAAPLVDTYSSAGGDVVERLRIVELPLNGRNVYQLASLLPGVSIASTPTTIDSGNRSGNFINVNGAVANQLDYQLDGVHFAGSNNNSGMNMPSPDALQEFKLVTNAYSAEYGIFSGAVFLAVTRSGTNQFHGSAWEFLRNDKLNARTFFLSTVPVLRQNQFGASAGFPIVKSKLFMFASYQGLMRRSTSITSSSPLTANERQGIFSTSIKDPSTGAPFPNNVIPQDRTSPVAARILKDLVPVGLNTGLLYVSASRPVDTNNWIGKWDYLLSSKDTLNASFMFDKTVGKNPFAVSSYPNFPANSEDQVVPLLSISETHTFSPRILNQFRYGRMTSDETRTCAKMLTPRDLGINMDLSGPPVPPGVSVSGRFSFGAGTNCSWNEGGHNWQITDTVNWMKGRHQLKFGGEYYFRDLILKHFNVDGGSFSFNGATTGNAAADFLLGEITSLERRSQSDKRALSRTTSLFVQDDFKVHPRLTLNLGLRYELLGPYAEVRGSERPEVGIPQQATIRYGLQSTVIPAAPRGLLFVGDKTPDFPDGLPNTMRHLDYRQIQPRVGFAWDPFGNGRTSVRSSFGLYSGAAFADMYQLGQNAPFMLAQTLNRPAGGFADPWRGIENPFPYKLDLKNPNKNLFPLPVQGFAIDPNYGSPRIMAITFNIQREIVRDLSTEVGYVGKLGRHLYYTKNVNTAIYIPGVDANGQPLSTLANIDARRRLYPGVFQKVDNQQSDTNSSYNSLQVTTRYRSRHGLTLLSSYTWSKALDLGESYAIQGNPHQDSENIHADWSPAGWDTRHVWRMSWVYNVPGIFKNQPTVSRIISGWELSGITSVRSGLPFTVMAGRDNSLTANGNDRADVFGDPKLPSGRSRADQIAMFFKTSMFKANQTGKFGNVGLRSMYGPASSNTDLGLFRNFLLREPLKMQFRAELFNAFNQVNFSNPSSTITSPTFGQLTGASGARVVQMGLKLDW